MKLIVTHIHVQCDTTPVRTAIYTSNKLRHTWTVFFTQNNMKIAKRYTPSD